jgi:hypothetical protein
METTVESELRLPLWGHLSVSADGRHTHLWGTPSADTADQALAEISRFVAKACDFDATEARVTVRPVGVSNGRPAARTLKIAGCDPVLGLSDDQKRRVLAALAGDVAPSIELVFTFAGDA